MSTIEIIYEFEFMDGKRMLYPLLLDKATISLIPEHKTPLPFWTELDCSRCSVCSLLKDKSPHCPIAANISDLVEHFKDVRSTEQVRITVITAERTYFKEATIQRGLSSIFGLIMATSGCPIMNFLKPMARYHLPFSTDEETIVRSVSMYLLRQYFIAKRRGSPDLSLERLDKSYSLVQEVNRGICSRISKAIIEGKSRGDAASNAVIILDSFSQLLMMEIEQKLDSLASLFEE